MKKKIEEQVRYLFLKSNCTKKLVCFLKTSVKKKTKTKHMQRHGKYMSESTLQ